MQGAASHCVGQANSLPFWAGITGSSMLGLMARRRPISLKARCDDLSNPLNAQLPAVVKRSSIKPIALQQRVSHRANAQK
jgi:hypothetical protein